MKALLGTFEIQSEPHSCSIQEEGDGEDEPEEEVINKEGPVKSELMNQSLLSVDVVHGEERKWVPGTSVHHDGETER